jgi:anti-sigma factor RsiW
MTETEFERRLSAAIREEMPPLHAPEELHHRVRAAIEAAVTPAGWSRYSTTTRWLALAASLAFVALGGTVGYQVAARRAGGEALAEQVLASHVRSLMPGHLTDVLSSDQHTVKPWFNGKLDFSPAVSDFSAQGFPLTGGRLDYVGGRPVAALVYARRQHIVSVFLWPATSRTDGPAARTRQGYHLLHWTAGDYTCWVASDLGLPELQEFAGLLRADQTRSSR